MSFISKCFPCCGSAKVHVQPSAPPSSPISISAVAPVVAMQQTAQTVAATFQLPPVPVTGEVVSREKRPVKFAAWDPATYANTGIRPETSPRLHGVQPTKSMPLRVAVLKANNERPPIQH